MTAVVFTSNCETTDSDTKASLLENVYPICLEKHFQGIPAAFPNELFGWDPAASMMGGFRNRLVWTSYYFIPAKKRRPPSQSKVYFISEWLDASWSLKSQPWKLVQVPEGQSCVFPLLIRARRFFLVSCANRLARVQKVGWSPAATSRTLLIKTPSEALPSKLGGKMPTRMHEERRNYCSWLVVTPRFWPGEVPLIPAAS